jgi:L-glyceraldehyde 3-phosphate reductase
MLNRWIEAELLDVLESNGIGCIGFTALAQGLLTGKYLNGVAAGSRAAAPGATLSEDQLNDETIARLRALADIASNRGQSLAQLALVWALRDPRVTSVVIGASSVAQLEENVAALDNQTLSPQELTAIDEYAIDTPDVDLWRSQSDEG